MSCDKMLEKDGLCKNYVCITDCRTPMYALGEQSHVCSILLNMATMVLDLYLNKIQPI